jgi:hypothetical protein
LSRALPSRIVALVVVGPSPEALMSQFSEVSSLFSNLATFTWLNSTEAANFESRPILRPMLILFLEGYFSCTCPFPQSDELLAFQLESWLLPPSPVIDRLADLFPRLGNTTITFIVKNTFAATADRIIREAIHEIGPSTILQATDQVFQALNFTDSTLALFRRADRKIVPVLPTTGAIFHASFVPGTALSRADFQQPGLIAVYLDDTYKEEGYPALAALADLFPAVRFGVLARRHSSVLAKIGKVAKTYPDFVVVYFANGSYFPSGDLEGLPITDRAWVPGARAHLENIGKGLVEACFVSEEADARENRGLAVKIVGSVYREFVEKTDEDAIIFYYEFTDLTHPGFADFEGVATELGTRVRFGFIDIKKNASPKHYPVFLSDPHVEFFTAGGKKSWPLLGNCTRGNLMRLIQSYSAIGKAVEPPVMTVEEAEGDIALIQPQVPLMPKALQEVALAHVKKLQEVATRAVQDVRVEPLPTFHDVY